MAGSVAVTVAAGGEGLAALLDGRFGRAPRFLLMDQSTGRCLRTLDNPAAQAVHGAGAGAAALMHEQGVAAVLSGRFGPQAFQALDAYGIAAWIAPAGLTAKQAWRRYHGGELERQQLRVIR